jgi:ABC-2 type transport system ATP-binding protein
VRDGEAILPEFIARLQAKGLDIAAANVRRPTLDDVFLGLTGRSLREENP